MQKPSDQDKQETVSVTRRDVLKMAGVGAIGVLIGSAGVGGVLAATGKLAPSSNKSATAPSDEEVIPFYGPHQAGIITPAQDFICLAAFDLTISDISAVKELFKKWTEESARMSMGEFVGTENTNPNLPPTDTGEAAGLSPSRTTITFGVGPSFFDHRFGLASKRPAALADIPHFAGDNLRPEWSGGDICVQVCADDMQVAFHAIRNLTRLARGTAVLRWTQEGFQRTGKSTRTKDETPRNLLGFKDGTVNPDTREANKMNQTVWAQSSDGAPWMSNGSYLVVRRIRMRIEVWDRTILSEQEATFGRYRGSGAPLGAVNEFDELPLDQKDSSGKPIIPDRSHVRLSHGDGSEEILRRGYSYSSGIDHKTGQLDAGLLFICYQRDPRKQFIPIQKRLAQGDKLNEYISHIGSAIFACFAGAKQGSYIGEGLF